MTRTENPPQRGGEVAGSQPGPGACWPLRFVWIMSAHLPFPHLHISAPVPSPQDPPQTPLSLSLSLSLSLLGGAAGMGSDGGEDYSWIDDVGGGLEEDFRWTLSGGGGLGDLPCRSPSPSPSFSHPTAAIEEAGGNAAGPEQMGSKKRARGESIAGTKTKACREKMRRDRLNDRFVELGSVLEPERAHQQSDKASILSDAARVLAQLRSEAQKLKEANEKLQETIRELKAEKTELRDEKTRLKSDKEVLEQQVKAMSLPPTGFVPHPAAFHAAGGGKGQAAMFPGLAMWHWLPPTAVDTSQDAKLWPPNA